jgi:uncharacterized damage-inducible protein DinB
VTTSAEVLRGMFEHHLWATETLIDHLDAIPLERLDDAVPGTYGSMLETLTHLLEADDRYLRRLRDPDPVRKPDRGTVPLEQLRDEVREHRERWGQALDDLEAGTLSAAVRNAQDYPDTDPAESMLLIQAIHHGNDHRTQICSTLGALELPLPEIDGWDFWADQHRT